MLKIGIVGAGAVGLFVGGRLADRGQDVVFVGRERLQRELAEHGLGLEDLEAPTVTLAPGRVAIVTSVDALADRDVVLCCVKSAQTREVARALAPVLAKDAIVVSLQNGLANAGQLREETKSSVLAGIVSFNVIAKGAGVFRRATTGPLVIEASEGARSAELERALVGAGLQVERANRIRELQWTKLLVNLNNAVGALSDRPTKELVLSRGYRRVLAALLGEGLSVLRAAGIRPARLGKVPIQLLVRALALPTPLVRVVARAQLQIDPEARSSMWGDLTSGRPTEVDWLNGEVVRLAESCGIDAPMNRRIVEMVHDAERAGAGSPGLSAELLWARMAAVS